MPVQFEILESCQNPTLRWILEGFDERYEDKLDQLKNKWSQKIRVFYRDYMGLRPNRHPLTVSYLLDDNGTFIDLIEREYPDLDFLELVQFNKFVGEAELTLPHFGTQESHDALSYSIEHAKARLRDYDLKEIIEKLFPILQTTPAAHVFGRYYGPSRPIEIYSIPCILFSMLTEVDFLDFGIETLAHELAHGFTHVGQDKDDKMWDDFWKTETDLIESLAEFYTREFALSVRNQHPGVLDSHNKTTKRLPDEYKRYKKWEKHFPKEAVYQALILARRNETRSFDDFTKLIKDTTSRLRHDETHASPSE